MKKLFSILFALSFFTSLINVTAAEKIKIDSTNFPDEKFCSLVQEKFDKNEDGYLGSTEIKNARTLSGVGRNIKSAKGIEYLPNLYYLNLRNNPLEVLDLKHNVKLKEIDIMGTKLKCIENIQILTRLETMKVSQSWLYNQNLDNIKVNNLEILCKEPFYISSRNTLSNMYINRKQFNKYCSGTAYVSYYYNDKKRVVLNANNNQTKIYVNFSTKKLVDPGFSFDLIQKTIKSVEIKFSKKSQYFEYDNSVDAYPDYYEIFRATSKDGAFKRMKLTTKTKYIHTGLTPYKTYYYKIRGYKKQSNGVKIYTKDTNVEEIKTEVLELCLDHKRANCDCCYGVNSWKRRSIRDANGKLLYKISWINNKDADGYEVGYMKDVNTCGESVCHNSNHKSEVFKVISRPKNGTYTYDKDKYSNIGIRAYRYVGGKKCYTWVKTP